MATTKRLTFLSNASATSSAFPWPGGAGTLHATGTFAGTSLSLTRLGPDGSTFTPVSAATTLTAAGVANFELGPCTLKVTVTGGTPSALYAEVVGTSS